MLTSQLEMLELFSETIVAARAELAVERSTVRPGSDAETFLKSPSPDLRQPSVTLAELLGECPTLLDSLRTEWEHKAPELPSDMLIPIQSFIDAHRLEATRSAPQQPLDFVYPVV